MAKIPAWTGRKGHKAPPPQDEERLVVDGYWVRKSQFFFRGVAHGRLPML